MNSSVSENVTVISNNDGNDVMIRHERICADSCHDYLSKMEANIMDNLEVTSSDLKDLEINLYRLFAHEL